MGGVSLLDGWLPVVLFSLGTLGAGFLLARPVRWWWLYYVPATLVVSTAAAWYFATTTAEDLFAEELPFAIAVWAGAVVASVLLAIGHFFRTPWWDKIVAVLAAIFVILLGVNQINRNYQQYPTVADLFGASGNLIAGPPPVDGSTAPTLPSGPLTQVWTPTGSNIPTDGGQTSEISLPGTTSGFDARDGYVYYPPAYFADNSQPLPVLILIHGQPGDPGDWFLGNRTQGIMDAFAAQHNGIAPIVVAPDGLGSQLANPLCTNSSLGQVGTYLSQDVPAAIKSQLRVDPDPKHWVFGGFSYGGTCALQMATNHPDEFPNFVDISGEREPTLGTHGQTVTTAFGGDEAAFDAINPKDIMASKQFPNTSGWFIVGSEDADYKAQQQEMYAAAQAAGMDVQYWESPGSAHDWTTAVNGLEHVMPWMAQKMNLTS